MRRIVVEACVDSVASARAAEQGGADRLELCDALYDGGTTPSAGMIAACKAAVSIPVFVIIRPRGGGFVYSDDERDVMRRDVIAAREIGADGVVIGGLGSDGEIDSDLTKQLIEAARDLPVTFHRAFDFANDPEASLEVLAQCGVSRVLTSGGKRTAREGARAIERLMKQARSRITIIAGGGVREENVRDLVSISGVSEVHVRLTRLVHDATRNHDLLKLRKALPDDDLAWEETSGDRIRSFVRTLNNG